MDDGVCELEERIGCYCGSCCFLVDSFETRSKQVSLSS